MGSNNSSSSSGKVAITVAIIGLIGTLLTVVINNWKNIFPQPPVVVVPASGGSNSTTREPDPTQSGKKPDKTTEAPAQTTSLSAPTLVSPENNAVFDIYPRHTTLTWQPVKNASSYKVEIEYNDGVNWPEYDPVVTQETNYSFDFIGAQPGRWRVSSIDNTGRISTPSDWRIFRYSK